MLNTVLPEDAEQFVCEFIDKRFWKFARTYAKSAPHSYTVREWQPDQDDEFVKMVLTIREYGLVEYFFRKPFIYLFWEGQKYWTMGEPVSETTLINRCPWENTYKL